MNSEERKIKARQTLDIIEKGYYLDSNRQRVYIENDIQNAVSGSFYLNNEDLKTYREKELIPSNIKTSIEITSEDSLSAILRLNSESIKNIMCLNFASAKKPGGGFLNGALSQEESLAMSSALYPTLKENFEYYQMHRNMRSCIYTDAMIYSPKVPVFRNNNGELMDNYCNTTFITCAAVNAGIVKFEEPRKVSYIPSIMQQRIENVLSVAKDRNHEDLILGAWGCGVFQNDPNTIANLFYKQLNGKFKNQFKRVVFAIYSRNEKFIQAFKNVFED
ncbi:MAG: TIGR02452 family protein [Flavobacteriaceae bacterium]|nr:TIGR02452 family protein [Flavobacteriaceae bacterium]|tara:strand:- start:271 stop:1098 length:828 start_codon:yes stop_codon:yes gene_type:complete